MARIRRRLPAIDRGSAPVLGAVALGGWALFYPAPYALCIVLLGLGALAALSLSTLKGGGSPARQSKAVLSASDQAGIGLSMVLAIRALVDVDLIDWQMPLFVAGACGLAFAGLNLASDRNRGRKGAVGVAITFLMAGIGFGWGASVEADTLLDRSAPAMHRLQVTEKWVTRGRTTRPHLRLAAPNDLGVDQVHVDGLVYSRTPIGGFVCVRSRDGTLGFRWYRVETCPTSAS